MHAIKSIDVNSVHPEPLSRAFNVAVKRMAELLFPAGYDVKSGNAAPDTLARAKAYLARTGRICVSADYSENTIFADRETNYAFRAWHDFHHIRLNAGFDRAGEDAVFRAQLVDLERVYGVNTVHSRGADKCRPSFADLLQAEVLGQLDYQDRHNGEFPADQMAFVLAFLADPVRAIGGTY